MKPGHQINKLRHVELEVVSNHLFISEEIPPRIELLQEVNSLVIHEISMQRRAYRLCFFQFKHFLLILNASKIINTLDIVDIPDFQGKKSIAHHF